MAKGKSPSPQEIYRARKQREEQEKFALLPPGLFNHGNTCFMNSVLQGLIATRLLSELVHFAPIPPSTQSHSATFLASRRSPQLTNGHGLAGEYEQKWVNTMPIGDMFLSVLLRAWEAQYLRRRENLSPKPILAALGKKYDQYLDFAQQDAHEFLRILLDAMSMEELDIIKKSHPPQPPKKRRRTSTVPPPPEDAPISLADMIFGGKFASILVCQKCKHVSHTYEDFNDLSLSIKQEDYGASGTRKRDRFKSLAKRLGTVVSLGAETLQPPRASSVPPSPRERPDGFGELGAAATATEEPRRRSLDIPAEDAEGGQEVDHPVRLNGVTLVITPDEKHIEFVDQPKEKKGKGKKDTKKEDDAWAKLGRRLSLGLGSRASKERKGRSGERASRDFSQGLTPQTVSGETSRSSLSEQTPEIRFSRSSHSIERESGTTTPKSRPQTPSPLNVNVPPMTIAAPRPILPNPTRSKSPKPPKPSAGETAYLRQILADVSTGSEAPLWLKLGGGIPGVEECLRMFTAVEVLDGENMVGCRRCWKIAHGEYVPRTRLPDEEGSDGVDENGDSEDSADNRESPVVTINAEATHHHRPTLPTSISSPLISMYSLPNINTAESASSLPLVTPPSSSSDSALGRSQFGDDTDTTPPSSASSLRSLPLSPEQEVETPPATVTVIPPTPSKDTFEAGADGKSQPSSLHSIAENAEVSPTAQSHLNGVGNPDPAYVNGLQPPRPERHVSDESTDGSSGDESDASVASGQTSAVSDAEASAPAKPRTKPKSKPKPVIMRPAYKRYLIAVPPPVLVIHLKRFQQVSKTMISFSNGFKKLDDYVAFPETLDLTPFLAPKKEDYGLRKGTVRTKSTGERCMYRLYAVVVHIGNMLGGHYISYVALPPADDIALIPSPPVNSSSAPAVPSSPLPESDPSAKQERQWAYISDTVVRLTTLEEVLKAKAYICMYERV
ncbi:hypothetical protein B0H11DRAFT_1951370 [Mycena galericulata]|nr:hypothetical protein B0H11DRAFT_1951370 [Mycena galericulata]